MTITNITSANNTTFIIFIIIMIKLDRDNINININITIVIMLMLYLAFRGGKFATSSWPDFRAFAKTSWPDSRAFAHTLRLLLLPTCLSLALLLSSSS